MDVLINSHANVENAAPFIEYLGIRMRFKLTLVIIRRIASTTRNLVRPATIAAFPNVVEM